MSENYIYTTWTPELATGNSVIDDQHKALIEALNALYSAHRNGKGHDEIERTLRFTLAYTIKHFEDEEGILEKNNYPDFLKHKQIHDNFRTVAERMVNNMLGAEFTEESVTNLYSTIGRWVFTHIMGEDFKWAAYLKSKAQ